MFNDTQTVTVRWSSSNRMWFQSLGYIFTKLGDEFIVVAHDLMPHSDTYVEAVCDYCGRKYETQYASIISGRNVIVKDCCSNCAPQKASDVSKRKRAEKYFTLAEETCMQRGYTLLTQIQEYTDVKMHIDFLCPRHGRQSMILDNFVRGHECRECSYEKRARELKYDPEYVRSVVERVSGNRLMNADDYKDVITHNLKIQCSCGKIFVTSFANYIRHGVNKCSSCSNKESHPETKIKGFLYAHNIAFEQEKRFDDCRDAKPLPFDFYLPTYNLIIEFDGQHHFFPVFDESRHLETKAHDKVKNEYCQSHGIRLLRIPYWDEPNMETIITTNLGI